MKQISNTIMLGAGVLLAANLTVAAGADNYKGHHGWEPRVEQELRLTDYQKKRIQPILEKYDGKFRELREDQRDDRERFSKLREQMDREIAPILTREQREKMARLRDGYRREDYRKNDDRRDDYNRRDNYGRHGDNDHRYTLERLSRELRLTRGQEQQVSRILSKHYEEMDKLFDNHGRRDRDKVRDRAERLRDKLHADLNKVLNRDQQRKLDTLCREHRSHFCG